MREFPTGLLGNVYWMGLGSIVGPTVSRHPGLTPRHGETTSGESGVRCG